MSNRSISQPAANTYSVVDLVAAALEGRIRIPEFQRPLRWQWEDVRRLFDSIVKGYPIGNLLLWKRLAPAAQLRLGGLCIDAKQFEEGWWVVDGQQRLISLANALSEEGARDSRFSLSYDLRKQTFVHPNQGDEGHIVPLLTLFDLQRLIRWFTKDHPEASEMLDEASRITRAIREYKIPAYLVDQDDEAVLRDIFDRMNSYGKRLSKAEIFSALHPVEGADVEPFSHFQRIAESIHGEQRFGIIDDDTVIKALLARRGADVYRDVRIEFAPERTRYPRDFEGESPTDANREGKLALSRAVRFLQEDACIPHFSFLPYRYLLVVLTRFFAHFPEPEPRNRVLLRRWFWRAALIGPSVFDGNWGNAMRTLSMRIMAGDETGSVQRLLHAPITNSLCLPKLTDFRPHWAEGRIALAALWALNPRSPLTGEAYECQQLADVIGSESTLRTVALRILRSEPQNHRYWAANRILVLEDEDIRETVENTLITSPLWLTGKTQTSFLDSHALDVGLIQTLKKGDKISFLEGRQRRIEQVVREFIGRMAESDLEDTPPLASFDLDDEEEERDDALA